MNDGLGSKGAGINQDTVPPHQLCCCTHRSPVEASTGARSPRDAIAVVVVGDDLSTRGVLMKWLQSAAHLRCVGIHESAEAAVRALPHEDPAVALVEVHLRGATGIECVRRLQHAMPETQFLMSRRSP